MAFKKYKLTIINKIGPGLRLCDFQLKAKRVESRNSIIASLAPLIEKAMN